jgi:hypothetical protein
MTEHTEDLKNEEKSQVSVHVSLQPELRSRFISNTKPFNLPLSPEEEYFESIGE